MARQEDSGQALAPDPLGVLAAVTAVVLAGSAMLLPLDISPIAFVLAL